MITPSFNLSQTDMNLIVTIHAPYTQLKNVEIDVLDSCFWFYASPYFLRLHFPHELVDDDEPPASFNADTGDFEITLTKQVVGQHFPDLDLLGTFLAPKKQKEAIKPTIEVLSETLEGGEHGANGEEDLEEEDLDEWLIDQELPQPHTSDLLTAPKYGFANQTSGVFHQVKSEFKEIISLPEPDRTPASEREVLRRAAEDEKFDSDYYLADFMETDEIQEYLLYQPPWSSQTPDTVQFTEEEKECLKRLGNKELLLSKEEQSAAWLSLVDIVFAWAYNHRTTLGDNTVESAWTINQLSATLSWLADFPSLQSVVLSGLRRLLCYGLVRNWDLAQLVLKDTIAILKLGRRQVLKCLLEVHSLFNHSEPRYLLNQLYISDYCVWLQKTSDRRLAKLTAALEQVNVCKSDLGFDLEELEQAALLVQQEEEEELTSKLKNIALDCNDRSSSSSSSCDCSSSSLDSDDDSSPES